MTKEWWNKRRATGLFAIFTFVYITHFFSGVIASGDSRWSIHTAQSILQEGNADLDEYPADLEENDYYWVEKIDGRYYTRFPLGASIIALPFVFVIDHVLKLALAAVPSLEPFLIRHCGKTLTEISVTSLHWRVELVIACAVIALAAVFMFLLARETMKPRPALVIAFVLAFCTSAWSTGSRSMGQHGPSMLILGIALYLYVVARRRPALIQYVALPLSFSYVVRPTNSIPIVVLTLCILVEHRRYFFRYLLWSLPVALPFVFYNYRVYHAPLSSYYRPQQLGTTHHFFEALAGTMICPSRGLLIFTPVFLCAGIGFLMKWRSKSITPLDWGLAAVFVLHWLAVASFGDWWGGHSYGPRYFTDLTPFLVYLMFPVVGRLAADAHKRATFPRIAFAVLLGLSFFMHARGATDLRTWAWNREPIDINLAPQRLWDWSDPQFLRDLFRDL